MSSCKDMGKQLSTQYYSRPDISAQELRNPETVISEIIGLHGEIIKPKVLSPASQLKGNQTIPSILGDLIIAEKVARRQYDELVMFPELSKFIPDLLYIRNDEKEHEKILECIQNRLLGSAQPAAAKPTQLPTKSITLTPKTIGELYETMLDRFGDEEEKSVKNYQDLLVKVQETQEALKKADASTYTQVSIPLTELERKVNKHLNEERVHLDVVDAMREMFTNMKLGNVY